MKQYTAILAGKALVGENLTARERACVLVEGGVIRDILTPAQYEAVKDKADTVDLGDATLLPGLFYARGELWPSFQATAADHLCPHEIQMPRAVSVQERGFHMTYRLPGADDDKCLVPGRRHHRRTVGAVPRRVSVALR